MIPCNDNEFERQAQEADQAYRHAEDTAQNLTRLRELVAAVQTLVAMFRAYRAGEFALSWHELAVLLTTLLYVVNPVDAVPEAVLGPAGLPDDVAAVAAAVAALMTAILRFCGNRRDVPMGGPR